METAILKVKSSTNVKALAGSISHNVIGSGDVPPKLVVLLAIGAGAVNQAIKALAISSGFIAKSGQTLSFRAGFNETVIDGEERTIIRLTVDIK